MLPSFLRKIFSFGDSSSSPESSSDLSSTPESLSNLSSTPESLSGSNSPSQSLGVLTSSSESFSGSSSSLDRPGLPSNLSALMSSSNTFGLIQRSGRLSVLPILGDDCPGSWTSPYSGLKFTGVHGYGHVSFHNDGGGTAILPMHMGYIQAGAQNHAMSTAAMLAKGQEKHFDDARCVQASQGGYLESREQWFFILPLKLREEALVNRSKSGYSVLWNAIGRLGRRFGSSGRGHLDDVICKRRGELNVYDRQFELLNRQVGAVIFLDNQPIGIEIGPTAEYFADIWTSLINFCYGSAALEAEMSTAKKNDESETVIREASLAGLRSQLMYRRESVTNQLINSLASCSWQMTENKVEETLFNMELATVRTADFYGQVIRDKSTMIYASMFRVGLGV